MSVAVTGGGGFIGSHLVRAFLKQNRDVRVIDNFVRGTDRNISGLTVQTIRADLRSYEQTIEALKGVRCVYQLAARVGSVDYLHGNTRADMDTLQTNISIDTNVFRACVELGIEKVLYASSVSVYPIDLQARQGAEFNEEETLPVNPEGGYGWAKFIGEYQLREMEGCKVGIARIFNAFGEYCEFGRSAQVVPALIRKAIRYPQEEFVVWGDGSQTRNLMYVGDLVAAFLKLEENVSYPPLIVNVGNPQSTTIASLAETIIDVSGKRIKIRYDSNKPVGPISRVPNIERAKRLLSWAPTTPLRTGLERTYNFIESHIRDV